MNVTEVLVVLGLLALIVFAYLMFPPAAVGAAGLSLLFVAYVRSRRGH